MTHFSNCFSGSIFPNDKSMANQSPANGAWVGSGVQSGSHIDSSLEDSREGMSASQGASI